MAIDGNASVSGQSVGLSLDEAYRALNNRRIELDGRITSLPPDDPAREALWQSLQPVMDELRQVVADLTGSPAADLSLLRAKAAILAGLLQAEDNGRDPIIPESERNALALSLANDIACFPMT
jgi:hypothetical protein